MCLMCMAGSAVALSIELLQRDCVIVLNCCGEASFIFCIFQALKAVNRCHFSTNPFSSAQNELFPLISAESQFNLPKQLFVST